jgi:hypothetical protein
MHYLLKGMATKKQTKQDLEDKIAELEAKLTKLATQLEAKPAETKPAEVKPAETKPAPAKPAEVKPAETKPAPAKPAEVTKPKGTLPKGFETKPADAPKTSETKAQPPSTIQAALENAYQNAKMTDFHWYRAHVTGYSPAPNRYFVRRTAPVGKVPTTNWNDQKAKVPGYTQPSNQYFATRPRLAYSPADKTFGGFSGITMTVDGSVAQTQKAPPPPPKPSEVTKPKGTLPKGAEQQQVSSNSGNSEKSRKEQLEEYERDYLKRIEQQRIEDEQSYQEAVEDAVKSRTNATHSALPKGFEPKPTPPEQPKTSRGTLPKGF